MGSCNPPIGGVPFLLSSATREADWAPWVRVIPRLGGFHSRSRHPFARGWLLGHQWARGRLGLSECVRPRLGGSPLLLFMNGKCGVTGWVLEGCMVTRQGDLPSAPSTWVHPLLTILPFVLMHMTRHFWMRRMEWGLATHIPSFASENFTLVKIYLKNGNTGTDLK